MSTNILEAIQSRLSDDVVSKFAASTGEAPSRSRSAMSTGAFVTVAGLIRRGATKEGAAGILSHLEGSSPGGLGLLGERRDDLSAIISESSGVSRTSATGVLSTLTPIAAAVLGKEVVSRNLDAGGLSSFLLTQRNSLLGHPGAPPGIAAALAPVGVGGGELMEERFVATHRDVSVVDSPRTHARGARATATHISTRTMAPWLAVLGGLALGALLLVGLFALLSPEVIRPSTPNIGAPIVRAPELPKMAPPEVSGQTTITSGEVPKAALDAESLKAFKVNFDFASTKMTPGGEESVKNLATMLEQHPNARIRLEGHTDRVGDADINAPLSFKRAEAVKQKLVAAGIDQGRIETIGLREKRPVASNGTKEGRLENRRVEAVLLAK